MQWNTQPFLAEREVLIEVPNGGELLEFAFEVARDPGLFDAVIGRMLDLSQQGAPAEGLTAWLERTHHLRLQTAEKLAETYETLCQLHGERRDHIWGFVTRNLVRPVWLSQEEQRADVVIGNPPWLSYRYMDGESQRRFREECQRRGIWMGQVAQQQDLSAYFFVKCVELYLKPDGFITFVMPYAAMTRRQFAGFRTGFFGRRQGRTVEELFAVVRFSQAWAFSDDVQPLFPVPSCVLFAERQSQEHAGGPLPETMLAVSGTLPRRDASPEEASQTLVWREVPWPDERRNRFTAGYAAKFWDGAVVYPRVLFTVEHGPVGRLGSNPSSPLVQSRRSNLEKAPWKEIPSLRANVEAAFLRPLYLGESIAPFRVLEPVMAVIPLDERETCLLDASRAQVKGYSHLAGLCTKSQFKAHGSTGSPRT